MKEKTKNAQLGSQIKARIDAVWKHLPGESAPTLENGMVRYQTEDADGHSGTSWETVADYENSQLEAWERWQKRLSMGRYKLNEAALAFANGTGEDARAFFKRLVKAIEGQAVLLYEPGSNLPDGEWQRSGLFINEVHWKGLNDWIKSNRAFAQVDWRFLKPKSIGDTGTPQKKWSDSDCKALAKEHRALRKDGNKRPTATLAGKHGISDSRIRALIRRVKKPESENSWQKNVGGR